MVEDSLAMAQRYVQEGRFRIARQEALIERLKNRGRDGPLHEAREILALLYAIQEQFEGHLEEEWARASDPPPRSFEHVGRAALDPQRTS